MCWFGPSSRESPEKGFNRCCQDEAENGGYIPVESTSWVVPSSAGTGEPEAEGAEGFISRGALFAPPEGT